MALIIGAECMSCGICLEECPNDAILESGPAYVIDPELCTECVGSFNEPQCVKVCPVDVITRDPHHSESYEDLLEKEKRLLDNRDPYL